MLKGHSTKIVNSVLLLGSAIAILVIAWVNSSVPAEDVSGPNFGVIGPDNRIYTRFSVRYAIGDLFRVHDVLARLPDRA